MRSVAQPMSVPWLIATPPLKLAASCQVGHRLLTIFTADLHCCVNAAQRCSMPRAQLQSSVACSAAQGGWLACVHLRKGTCVHACKISGFQVALVPATTARACSAERVLGKAACEN